MSIQTFTSDDARTKWRELIDLARHGDDVVIQRYGKPAVAVIDYELYQAVQDFIDEARAVQRAEKALESWLDDPSSGRPYSELRQELRGKSNGQASEV